FTKEWQRLLASPIRREIVKAFRVLHLNRSQLARMDRHRFKQVKPRLLAKRVVSRELGIGLQAPRRSSFFQGKAQHRARGARRLDFDSHQLQELALVRVGYTIKLVYVHLRNPGEEIKERDPRIVDVMVGPIRRIDRDQGPSLIYEVGPAA